MRFNQDENKKEFSFSTMRGKQLLKTLMNQTRGDNEVLLRRFANVNQDLTLVNKFTRDMNNTVNKRRQTTSTTQRRKKRKPTPNLLPDKFSDLRLW